MNTEEDIGEAVSEEDFAAAERMAVELAEAELAAAIDTRDRLSAEIESERERQLHETFDGDCLVEFERRIEVAGKAATRARQRLAVAKERLREKDAEYRRLLEERYRAQAVEAVDHLHRETRRCAPGLRVAPQPPRDCREDLGHRAALSPGRALVPRRHGGSRSRGRGADFPLVSVRSAALRHEE